MSAHNEILSPEISVKPLHNSLEPQASFQLCPLNHVMTAVLSPLTVLEAPQQRMPNLKTEACCLAVCTLTHAASTITSLLFAGTSIDLVPLLYQPADFEAKPGNSPGTNKAPTSRAPSVLDALHSLNQQCHVFKKSAEQLGEPAMGPAPPSLSTAMYLLAQKNMLMLLLPYLLHKDADVALPMAQKQYIDMCIASTSYCHDSHLPFLASFLLLQ